MSGAFVTLNQSRYFHIFMTSPKYSPHRKRPEVYGSYMFGPEGKRVQIIIFDTRYFKDISGRRRNTASEEEKEKQSIVGCICLRKIRIQPF